MSASGSSADRWRGIVLAGGAGTRLRPLTDALSKQLLPIYNKPMIFYSLSALMLAKIRQVLIITTPQDQSRFKQGLGDGHHLGMTLSYAIQEAPRGIAEAFLIGEDFLAGHNAGLVLGDNIFYGQGFPEKLAIATGRPAGATLFAYSVKDAQRFGVIEFDNDGRARSLEEKPTRPKSNYAVTGLYFFDNQVVDIAKGLRPSARGELEITDIGCAYLDAGRLNVEPLGRGYAWFDAGTHDSLLEASQFVQTIERRQGFKIACLEEIAWRNGWISRAQLRDRAADYGPGDYGSYLRDLADGVE